MFEELAVLVSQALGLRSEPQDLTLWQMSLRAIIIFVVGVALVRLGDKRLRGKNTAFDIILTIVVGSVLSRAINGSAPFPETLVAAAVLVGMHWLLGAIAFKASAFGSLVKGKERLLVRDGNILWDAMRKGHVSERDLASSIRLHGGSNDVSQVRRAYLERSGDISIIPSSDRTPRVVEVTVEDGVQTVRVEIE